jgi:hypothetical protein
MGNGDPAVGLEAGFFGRWRRGRRAALRRHALVGDLVDEAGVGAVLQQAADQVGQQVAMAADRRIDPRGDALFSADEPLIEAPPMPCRRWNSKSRARAGPLQDGRDGQRVVGGEGRIDARRVEHRPGAGEVGDVGRRLAGEHRIVGQAALLAALDLAVPVGALDQAHHQLAAPVRAAQVVSQAISGGARFW